MICPKCGHEAKETDRFCVKCATKLVPSADEIEAAAEAAVNEFEAVDAPRAPEPFAYDPESPSTLDEAFGEVPPAAPLPETEPVEISEPVSMEALAGEPESSEPTTIGSIAERGSSKPLTTWGFVWRILLFMIPIFNIIPLFIFAFASGINKNSRSFARAVLILMLVGVIILLVGIAVLFVIFNGQGVLNGIRQFLISKLG